MHLGDAAVYAAHFALVQVAFAVDVVWNAFLETRMEDVVESQVHGVELDLSYVDLFLAYFLSTVWVDK